MNETTKNLSEVDVGEKQNVGIKQKMEEKNNTEAQMQELKGNEEDRTDIEGEIEKASSSGRENGLAAVPVISVQAASESEGEDKEEKEESDEMSDNQKSNRATSGISSPARNTQNGEYLLKPLPN